MNKFFVEEAKGPELIKGVSFFDTPPEDDEGEEKSPAYVPSELEWKSTQDDIRFTRYMAGLGIAFGAASLIVAIMAFAPK